ncbi:N-terminal Xaa-Pro-Lys N-methyltransferase 1 isoform X2 [Agrilus planipennis]|uniref:Alpha N-terminal protein methyltransferase 1 n=1 Tax=Agrilus planipennis TaxID=224129 RepID=A0A1W4X645_AGRPL|nr:N-terminal Xaa-Pro-Lys N-methyltransferase 1 isoform X2 [Agrilus planipennis]
MDSDTEKVESYGDPISSIVTQQENLLDEWYLKAEKYWSEIPATVDGVLGGFGFISQIDIHESKKFLQQILKMKNAPKTEHALDCGAGIGRITKCLLSHVFEKVDLVEQNPQFLEAFKNNIEPEISLKIENIFCCGLQNFTPKEEFYDVIWIQWVLGHLTDTHFVKFLTDCRS